jgi:hypothetical protein
MTTNLCAKGFKRFDIPVYLFTFSYSSGAELPLMAARIGGHAVRTEHKLASLSNIAFFPWREQQQTSRETEHISIVVGNIDCLLVVHYDVLFGVFVVSSICYVTIVSI